MVFGFLVQEETDGGNHAGNRQPKGEDVFGSMRFQSHRHKNDATTPGRGTLIRVIWQGDELAGPLQKNAL